MGRQRNIQRAKKEASNQPPQPQNLWERLLSRLKNLWNWLLGNPQNNEELNRALNRLIWRTFTGIVIVIGAFILIALFNEYVRIPGEVVARVNGQPITVAQFRDRVRFERARITQLAANFEQQAQMFAQQFGVTDNQQMTQFLQQFMPQEYQQYQTWQSELGFPDQLGKRVLDEMVDELLIAQKAKELNISVDEAKVQASIDRYFGYDPTQTALIGVPATATIEPTITPTPFVSPTPSPTPTATLTPTPEVTAEATAEATAEVTAEATAETTAEPTPAQPPTVAPSPTYSSAEVQGTYEANVKTYRETLASSARIPQQVIDDYFRQQALRDAISDTLLGENNKTLYVNARHILVDTEEQAQEIIAALKSGESFADLARAISKDTGSGANGGELGWAPAANYVKEFERAVKDAPIGEIIGPIKTEFGYHIIQVRAREERQVPEDELDQVKAQLFAKWLTNLRETSQPGIELSGNWVDYVPQN